MSNKKNILLLVVLVLVVITASLVASTYAKYTAELDGISGTATVAKWAFAEDNKLTDFTISLSDTVDASTLVANRVAPGTSGSFDIALVNTNSDVAVDFKIASSSLTNLPTNLKLYADPAHTKAFNESTPITGVLAAKDASGVTAKIYWVWDYEQTDVTVGDNADNTDGISAKEITVGIEISGVQRQASSTAVTSKIN